MKGKQVGVMGEKGEQVGDGRWMMGCKWLEKTWERAGERLLIGKRKEKEIGPRVIELWCWAWKV